MQRQCIHQSTIWTKIYETAFVVVKYYNIGRIVFVLNSSASYLCFHN